MKTFPLDLSAARSTSSALSWSQTGPFHEEQGHLVVRTELNRPSTPPAVTLPRAPSAPGQSWAPLHIGEEAWVDRSIAEWLGDNPVHLAADAITSRTFLGHMALSLGVVMGSPALDERAVPLGIRGAAAMGAPMLGYWLLR